MGHFKNVNGDPIAWGRVGEWRCYYTTSNGNKLEIVKN